jgi:hypothetical protein
MMIKLLLSVVPFILMFYWGKKESTGNFICPDLVNNVRGSLPAAGANPRKLVCLVVVYQ